MPISASTAPRTSDPASGLIATKNAALSSSSVLGDPDARAARAASCSDGLLCRRRTIRYSVPHRLVRQQVYVRVGDDVVVIFDGPIEVARYQRGREPHQRIADPKHFEGIYREREASETFARSPIGRGLEAYVEAIGGAA